MTQRETSLLGLVAGFRLAVEGARMLLRERSLWSLAVVPVLLSLAAFAVAIGAVVTYAGALHGFATDWMPALEAARWYAWLWVGPARLGLAVLGALLFLLLAGVCLVVAYLVASVLAAPFHDALAARVERLVTGTLVDQTPPGVGGLLREAARSLLQELRRLVYFAGVVGPLALIGLVLPPAHVVTGPAILAVTIFFLPLDYASYTLDRRRVPFAGKRRWLRKNAPVTAGFGAAAFLACSVPVLNFAAMPLLVVGGTLLALRYGPPASADPGAPSPR